MKRRSIASRINIILTLVALVIVMFSVSILFLGIQVNNSSQEVINSDMPAALNSLAMLEELGDMNSNLLEYVLGEREEKEEYYGNLDEFHRFSSLIPDNTKHSKDLDRIIRLVKSHEETAKARVFTTYDPIAESNAALQIKSLLINVGKPLETLLDQMKDEEIADVGTAGSAQDVITDDLPGVRFYLELVDEAGDMLADLDRFVLGDLEARRSFFSNALQFEHFLAQLKPLEQKPQEVINIREIERMFNELKVGGIHVFESYKARSKLQALEAIDDLEHQNFKEVESLLDTLSDTSRKDVQDGMLSLTNLASKVTWAITALTVAAIGLIFLITIYTRRAVFIPINQITQVIERLRKGDHTFTLEHENRNDELGDILKNLSQFQKELAELDKLRQSEQKMQDEVTSQRDKAEQTLEDLKNTQSKLVATEKLAALGSLVAGVAHEVNTPIGVSVTIASTIDKEIADFLSKVKSGQITRTELDEFDQMISNSMPLLSNALGQASDLIHSFKQVAADQTSSKRRQFNLKSTLHEVLATLHHQVKRSKITYTLDGPDDIEMDSYPGPLGQIISNLFNNALLHAFDDQTEGAITIRFTRISDEVRIIFSDNGKGISDDQLQRIFDPFFTTKLGKGGSGLGLNIVHNLVTGLLGGNVHVESKVGTTFELKLPVSAPIKADAHG